jgi:hypothetical protein
VGARVFNMSLALERQVADDSYGQFAAQIDSMVDEHDVVFVLPAGNLPIALCRSDWPDDANSTLQMLAEYRHAGKDRILQPAESIRAIVTGAVNPPTCAGAALRPANYTRRGPSAALGTKPDVAHVGGRGKQNAHELVSLDQAGLLVDGCGTSYAAPLVARLLANLDHQIQGYVERETLFALLVHHARPPDELCAKSLERVGRDFVGFGIPDQTISMLETGDQAITLIFTGSLENDRELAFPFAWPTSLVTDTGQCRGSVRLTLVYRPPVDARLNLDAHLRQESFDPKTGKPKWDGRLRSDSDKRYERQRIENGQKWWPVKQYSKRFEGKGKSSQWRLIVEGLARVGTRFPEEGVPFSVVLTIEGDPSDNGVFGEMRQGIQASGARIADIRTANRVRAQT